MLQTPPAQADTGKGDDMTEDTCAVEGCDKPRRRRDWCGMHYERWRLHGSTDDRQALDVRLWSRIDRNGDGGCWNWTGGLNAHGYGQIMEAGRNMRVHRLVWEKTQGLIPPGAVLCHRCDNPRCCNPDHLWVGTKADNSADMVSKGRQSRYTPLTAEERSARLLAMPDKACGRCGERKPPTDFALNAARQDGLQTYCLPCWANYRKERRVVVRQRSAK